MPKEIVNMPDLLPVTNEEIETIIMAGMTGALMPMPYHEGHLYNAIGYDFDQVPSPNMVHHIDGQMLNRIGYHPMDAHRPRPRPPTKRQKTLKARALDKANRKRARHG